MFAPERPAHALPPALARDTGALPEPPGAIAAIGRRINALSAEHDACDHAMLKAPEGSPAHREAAARMDRLMAEILALYEQAGALRAETLADAAVQALACVRLAERLNVNDLPEADACVTSAKILHIAAGVAVALARIGRFNLARLGDVDDADFCARELARPWSDDARAARRGAALLALLSGEPAP